MSWFRGDTPRLADRLRGRSGDELLQELETYLMDNDALFEPVGRFSRDFKRDPNFPRSFYDYYKNFGRDDNHLDPLAARHEITKRILADRLRSDVPFHRRRHGSGSSNSGSQHGHQDEDARSQASGSSTASGASAVSSHSSDEPDSAATSVPSSSIPYYGLRNTVDIGQQQRRKKMENMEKNERGQRSMSAPPENRQQQQAEQQPQSAGQPPRFVSRVDITPQHNKQQQQRAQSPKPPSQQHSSNVRHIPIFVEGRDEPVIPRFRDNTSPPSPPSSSFQRQQSPFQRQQSPPHFHRPSYFNDHHHFGRQQWPPSDFQEAFYEPSFEQPTMRRHQQQPFYQQPQHHPQQHQQPQHQQPQHQQPQHQRPQYYQQQQPQYQQQQPQQSHQQQQQPQYHQQENQQQQQQPQQEMPKPKPPVPKDPLEKVAQVQKEVDDLAEQVQRYVGGSRQDKEYVYLDEMLTRELIKLDDIETEGRENVRQARKNAIKTIQDTISLLETKAGQQERSLEEKEKEGAEIEQREETPRAESMETDTKLEKKHSREPIPLPPAPSSPTKTKTESSGNDGNAAKAAVESMDQSVASSKQDNERTDMVTERKIEDQKNMEQLPAASVDESQRAEEMTIGEDSSNEKSANDAAQTAENDATKTTAVEEKVPKQGEGKTQVGVQNRTESPRLQKKTKKTKKQQQQQSSPPVSEQAIPLPPPPPTESAK